MLEAKATIATTDEMEDTPWIAARDMAVLSLCYGAGLRISEALASAAPISKAPRCASPARAARPGWCR